MAKQWTWNEIRAKQATMTDAELDKAIASLMPDNIRQIIRKFDSGADLTDAEQARLDAWESSPQSGPAGSIMSGGK